VKSKVKGSNSPKKRAIKEQKEKPMGDIVEAVKKEHISDLKAIPEDYFELDDKSIQLFPSTKEEGNNESDIDFDMDCEPIQPLELETAKDNFTYWSNGRIMNTEIELGMKQSNRQFIE